MSYIPAAKMPHAVAVPANDDDAPAPRLPRPWLALGGFAAGAALALLAGGVRR